MASTGRRNSGAGRGRGRGRGTASPKALPSPPGSSSRIAGPGNAQNDGDLQDRETMRLWIWEELCADGDLVLPTYMSLMSKKRERVDFGEDTFLQHAEVVGYDTLANMSVEEAIDFLVKVSDLTNVQLVAIRKKNKANLFILVHASLQMPMRMPLGEYCVYKAVADKFLTGRNELVGSRLRNFSKNGGLRADHTLVFEKTGMYIVTCKNQLITSITHFNGDKGTLPEAGLSSKYVVWDNHCDWTARLVMPMMPDVPLHSFFAKSKTGPYRYAKYHGNPKLVAEDTKKLYDTWVVAERARTSSGSSAAGLTAQLATELEDHEKQQRQNIAKKARQQAVKAIQAQKTAMEVKLQDDTQE